HEAASRVTTIEGALRSLEHFDAFEVVDGATVHERVGERHLVLICADGRSRRQVDRVEADPAQRVYRDPLVSPRNVEAWNHRLEIFGGSDAQIFECVARKGLDCEADVIDRL